MAPWRHTPVGLDLHLLGITIRLAAFATLRKQFTETVSILEKHELVDTGIYGIIRHPAYLGHLAFLLGIGLILGNWVCLAVLVVVPLAGILYRIHVEERALLGHFGPAYQEYAGRTKRLLPGIWSNPAGARIFASASQVLLRNGKCAALQLEGGS